MRSFPVRAIRAAHRQLWLELMLKQLEYGARSRERYPELEAELWALREAHGKVTMLPTFYIAPDPFSDIALAHDLHSAFQLQLNGLYVRAIELLDPLWEEVFEAVERRPHPIYHEISAQYVLKNLRAQSCGGISHVRLDRQTTNDWRHTR
jgi:hypothetical protein